MEWKDLFPIIGALLTINSTVIFYLAKRNSRLSAKYIEEKIKSVRDEYMLSATNLMSAVKDEKDERKSCLTNSNRTSSEIFGKLAKLTDNVQELLKEMGDMKQSLGRVEGRLNGGSKY